MRKVQKQISLSRLISQSHTRSAKCVPVIHVSKFQCHYNPQTHQISQNRSSLWPALTIIKKTSDITSAVQKAQTYTVSTKSTNIIAGNTTIASEDRGERRKAVCSEWSTEKLGQGIYMRTKSSSGRVEREKSTSSPYYMSMYGCGR